MKKRRKFYRNQLKVKNPGQNVKDSLKFKTTRIGKYNLTCPYCGSKARIVDSTEVYKNDYNTKIWVCGNYPECDSFVGTHKGGIAPLGTLANKELREKRKICHFAFDQCWKGGKVTRNDAYRWLSRKLEISPQDTHIGMFDLKMCNRMIEIIKRGELMEMINI